MKKKMQLTQIKPMKTAPPAIEFESEVSKTQQKPIPLPIKQNAKPQKITLDYLVRNNIINKTDKLYSEIEKGQNKGQKEYADIYYNESRSFYGRHLSNAYER